MPQGDPNSPLFCFYAYKFVSFYEPPRRSKEGFISQIFPISRRNNFLLSNMNCSSFITQKIFDSWKTRVALSAEQQRSFELSRTSRVFAAWLKTTKTIKENTSAIDSLSVQRTRNWLCKVLKSWNNYSSKQASLGQLQDEFQARKCQQLRKHHLLN